MSLKKTCPKFKKKKKKKKKTTLHAQSECDEASIYIYIYERERERERERIFITKAMVEFGKKLNFYHKNMSYNYTTKETVMD